MYLQNDNYLKKYEEGDMSNSGYKINITHKK
jgi:hypothetical protein